MSRLIMVVLASAMLIVPVGVLAAGGTFTDDDNSIFESDIEWMADAGVTKGCGIGLFCPDDNVTRGQMAAFMRRLASNRVVDAATASVAGYADEAGDAMTLQGMTPADLMADAETAVGLGFAARGQSDPVSAGNGVVVGLSLDLNIPTAGILVVNASVDMMNLVAIDALACGINFGGDVSLAQSSSWRTVDLTANAWDTCSTMAVWPVVTGSQIARVVVSSAQPSTEALSGTMTATLYTFNGAIPLAADEPAISPAPSFEDTTKQGR